MSWVLWYVDIIVLHTLICNRLHCDSVCHCIANKRQLSKLILKPHTRLTAEFQVCNVSSSRIQVYLSELTMTFRHDKILLLLAMIRLTKVAAAYIYEPYSLQELMYK